MNRYFIVGFEKKALFQKPLHFGAKLLGKSKKFIDKSYKGAKNISAKGAGSLATNVKNTAVNTRRGFQGKPMLDATQIKNLKGQAEMKKVLQKKHSVKIRDKRIKGVLNKEKAIPQKKEYKSIVPTKSPTLPGAKVKNHGEGSLGLTRNQKIGIGAGAGALGVGYLATRKPNQQNKQYQQVRRSY